MLNQMLDSIQEKFFNIFIFITYLFILLSFLGLSNYTPKYLEEIDYYVRIYICLFLIWRFNPFRKLDAFTNLDRKIAFSAGLFIITTTALNKYIIDVKEVLQHMFIPNQQSRQ